MPGMSSRYLIACKLISDCIHAQGMTVGLFSWQMSTGCQGTCHIAVAIPCGRTERLLHIDPQRQSVDCCGSSKGTRQEWQCSLTTK